MSMRGPSSVAVWLYFQSEEQRQLFSGLYFQGIRNQTPEQRFQANCFRAIARATADQADQERLDALDTHECSNSPKYAGPFVLGAQEQ